MAKDLYLVYHMRQKEIANIYETTQQTVSKWVKGVQRVRTVCKDSECYLGKK